MNMQRQNENPGVSRRGFVVERMVGRETQTE
jgi:hypothetical protein